METRKPVERVPLVLAYNGCAINSPCALCGGWTENGVPLGIFLEENPRHPVCDPCARQHAPELVLLLDHLYFTIISPLDDYGERIQSLLVEMDARNEGRLRMVREQDLGRAAEGLL